MVGNVFAFSSLHSCAAANNDALMAAGIPARIVAVMDMHGNDPHVAKRALQALVNLAVNGAYLSSYLQTR